MSSLTHLREKHHQMWSQVPSWTITQTSIDAVEEAKLHSSEVAQLQQTLHNAAASLDEVKIKLADTSREKEEVISQLAQLQQECTKLQAQVCDLERRTSSKEGENEEGNNNNNNADVENKTVETDASPHHSSAVTLLRSQNEKLLEQVESLTRQLHNNNNQNHQNEDAAEKSQIQNSILSRFLNIASQNQQEHEQQQQDGEENLQETIRQLRHQLAFAEERALIAERVSARATAESTSQQNNNNNNNKSVDGSTCSSPKNRPQKSQLDDNDEAANEDANNEDDGNVLPRRRQRPQQQGHVKSPKSNFASTCELETLGETNVDSLPPPSGGLHSASSSDVTLPRNQTELMRFWTFGQRQISKLKQEVAAANTRVDHVSMKAQASESLARSRSELIQNIQSLAGELEASRDECSRMRIDVEAKETENSILAAHLANALAAAMSHDEIQRCAGQLREAAQKTATIAAMTAPEMSVAKDAMKKNQALQHELKLMAKRRDDLNEEIVSKQRMLEDMASHSWLLKHTSANDDDDGEDDANNRKGGVKSNAASDASSLFHSNLFGVSQAVIAVFNSATTKFQDQIHQQELQLAEKENIIFELEKRLTCSYIVNGTDEDSAVAINNNNVDDDEITNNDNSTTFLSLRQDTTITALKQKLHSARSRITQQNIFIETSIAVIGDVSGLVNNLMKLLDSLLSSHALFGNNNAKNPTHQEQGTANNNSNNNQNTSEDSASSSSLMTPEERAVITKVLSVLEEHKNLVNERLSLIEMFKKLGENSEEISACSTLEKRVLELSESKKQVSELMKKLEDVQKENAEQSSWYGVVEKGIAELKQQGEDLERENISAWSLFSEIALQKLEAGVKEQITGAKPAIPAVVASSVVASNSNVDGAKEALQKSVELLSGK